MIVANGQHYFDLPGLPVRICRVNRRLGLTHPHDLTEQEHCHDFIEIVLILSGVGTQVIRGEPYRVQAGDVFVLQGFQSHYFSECADLDIVNVMFDPVKRPDLLSDPVKRLSGYQALFVLEPKRRDSERFRNMLRLGYDGLKEAEATIRRIEGEIRGRSEGYDVVVRNALESMVVALSRAYMRLEKPNALGLIRIQCALDHIESNLNQDLGVDELASLACLSPRHFQRLFRTVTGLPPNLYIRRLRVERACRLLEQGDASVADAAQAVGFHDRHYFSRVFRKTVGCSPRTWLKGLPAS
jgi:AraC-like DNA-binding protein